MTSIGRRTAEEGRGDAMAGPIVYVGFHSIKQGQLEVARKASRDLVTFVETNHPRFLHFEIGFSEAGDEMRVVQVHPDEESLALHMQLAGEKIAASYSFLEGTTGIHIFGDPSEAFTSRIQEMALGAPVSITRADSGFSRLSSVPV
jgi:hypothetical protein